MVIDTLNAAGRRIAAIALACLLAACASPPPTPDLGAFLQRREICDHLRGEFPDPPDPDRVREIEQSINEYCTGTDAQLAALKIRYRDDAAVLKTLSALEPRIEETTK